MTTSNPLGRRALISGLAGTAVGGTVLAAGGPAQAASDAQPWPEDPKIGVNVWQFRPDDPKGDWTAAFQQAIDLAARVHGRVLVPAGVYSIGNITIPTLTTMVGLGADSSTFSYGGTQNGGANLHRRGGDPARAMVTVSGVGVTLQHLILHGAPDVEAPLLHYQKGYDSCIDSVRLTGTPSTALLAEKVGNTDWRGLYVCDSGGDDTAAVVIKSPKQSDPTTSVGNSNTVTLIDCTIERSKQIAIDIAWGSGADQFVEFVRFIGLHVETVSTGSDQATIRVGTVRSVEFDDCFIYGGPGRSLLHYDQKQWRDLPLLGGVHFVGGTLLGANPTASGGGEQVRLPATPTLVRLTRGTDVAFTSVRMGQFRDAAVTVGPDFGEQLTFDATNYAIGIDEELTATGKWKQNAKKPILADERSSSPTVRAGNQNPGGEVTIDGDRSAGVLALDVGAAATAGEQALLRFGISSADDPVITLTPASAPAAASPFFVTATRAGFSIRFTDVPSQLGTSGGAYRYNYRIDRLRR